MYVYVVNKNGKPLMPCSPAKAKHLLKAGKAKVIRREPFTIKLLWDCEENVQEVVAGMDTGSKTIGCAAIVNGKVVYQSEVQLRVDISDKTTRRKMYRKARRQRKCRYRKPRWQNRGSSLRRGRLVPSVKSKINSHLREKSFVEAILPISRWKVETATFDIHKISNPDVKGVGYQEGRQKDFYNTKAYILYRDGYGCKSGQSRKHSKKLQVHHIISRSHGGTNSPDNLITLCEDCHNVLHAGEFILSGKKTNTRHATEMGILKSQLKKLWDFEETFGYETKFKREQVLELPKSHVNDAIAVCCEEGESVKFYDISLNKKHIPKGDYRQTYGKRSELNFLTEKLFGLRKFDLVKTPKGVGFVKGRRARGVFKIIKLDGSIVGSDVNVKKDCMRLSARTTTLIERRKVPSQTNVN